MPVIFWQNLVRCFLKCLIGISILMLYFEGFSMYFYICSGLVGFVIFFTCFIVPFAFWYFPSLMRNSIFQPQEEVPAINDYKHPENYGFFGGRNFYLSTDDGAKLGVWHTLPKNLRNMSREIDLTEMIDSNTSQIIYDDWLANATVFLYLHGSAGTRTSVHRLKTYRLLNSLGYHVIAFDYRGYGDSTLSTRSESDLMSDTLAVFSWMVKRVTSGNIYLWGHSLGTGVAASVADFIFSHLDDEHVIKGIVLEAPFNNMAEAVRVNWLTQMFSFLPWFEYCFIQPLNKNGLGFQSDGHLKNISTPVLILHAKDDKVVPYSLAEQLYSEVAASRKEPKSVQIIGFNSVLGYGHYNITDDPNMDNITRNFVEEYSTSIDYEF